jgi:hypothetical protein
MTDPMLPQKFLRPKKFSWWWSGFVASGLAGVAMGACKGCWHGKMGWPIGIDGYSYQVCLNCGAIRLFDEKTFSAYGPFRYELQELIAWEKSRQARLHAGEGKRPA